MQINKESQAYLYALAAVLLWSSVATGFKLGLGVLAVEQLLLAGSVVSWCVFAVYAALTRSWAIRRADIGLAVVLGVINPCCYYLILFAAYDRLPAHIAQPLNYTWAITLALLAVPILKQPLTRRMLGGIVVSYLGVVVLLATADQGEAGTWDMLGIALALFSTVLWASYWLLNTRSASPPAALMLWSFSVGTPLVLIACLLGPGLPAMNADTAFYGAWVGVIEMGVTFLLWQQALRLSTQAARIGQLIFLSPFVSLVIIHFVLGEYITWGAVGALLVIVLGLRIAQTEPS